MLDNSEYKLEGYIGWVPMLGYLDTASDCLTRFKEFKTGKTEWTQEKANSHWQLYIYAILLEQETWYIPECELIWRKTENRSDWTIWFTDDEPKIFPIEWDEHRMKHWRKEVPRIWTEIQEAHKAWEADEGKEYDDACLIEYAEYQRKIKELQSKAESLKPFISALLDQKGSKITTKDWSWYYTEKKIYEYPEEILRAEAIVDKAKDEFKKTAEAKISKSLTFRLW